MTRRLDRQHLVPALAVGFGIALVGTGQMRSAPCPLCGALCHPVDRVGPCDDDAPLDDPPEGRTAGLQRLATPDHPSAAVALTIIDPLPLAWARETLDCAPKQSPPH